MKKTLISLTFSVLNLMAINSFSQIKTELSKPFKELASWSKLLILENGSTLLFEVTDRDGIQVTPYDAKHMAKPTKKIELKNVIPKMQYVEVTGIYQIDGDAVLFFTQYEAPNPTLVRVIVDATGNLVKEDIIGNLPAMSGGQGYAMAFGGVDIPSFDVVKDPDSDCYSMIIYSSFEKESGKRIEMVNFDGNHKEIGRAFYNCPKEYKYLRYMNAYIKGTQYSYMIVYGYNSKKSGEGEKDSRMFIAKLKNGEKSFESKELVYTDDYKYTRCEMSYNKKAGILNFIIFTQIEEKRKETVFHCVFQPVQPDQFKLAPPFDLPFDKAASYAINKLKKKDFKVNVMDVYFDDAGNYHALLQETSLETGSNGTQNLSLDALGYSIFDNSGNEISGVAIPIKYDLPGITALQGGVSFRYMQAKEGYKPADRTIAVGKPKNWYKTIDMIYAPKGNYIFFNDMAANMEVPEGEKVDNVLSMGSGVTSFMIQVSNNSTYKREYLYGTPKDKRDLKFSNFYASCYDKSTGVYATIMTDTGDDKKTYLVWMKLP
jgi:hypothetical protein